MSGAQLFMKEDLKITDTQIEILAGVINIYSLFGSLAAGFTSDWLGRRYTMVLAAAIFFTGALLMGLAPDYALLMVGRFVAGIGVGFALMIAPVYTAEVAPTSARGFLTSFPEVFNNFGILLGYVSNFAFARLPVHLSWRAMFLVGAVPPVFLGVAVLAMPESPRWLVMRGRIDDARRVLQRTSDSPAEAEERLLAIKKAVGIPEGVSDADDVAAIVRAGSKQSSSRGGDGVWRELLINPSRPVRRMLVAGLGLMFIQQATGVDCVVMYSPRVFEQAGIKSQTNWLGASMAVGASMGARGRRRRSALGVDEGEEPEGCGGRRPSERRRAVSLSVGGRGAGEPARRRRPGRRVALTPMRWGICRLICGGSFFLGGFSHYAHWAAGTKREGLIVKLDSPSDVHRACRSCRLHVCTKPLIALQSDPAL